MEKIEILSDDVSKVFAPWQISALKGFADTLPAPFSLVLSAEPASGELLLVTDPEYVAAQQIIPTDAVSILFPGVGWQQGALADIHALVGDVNAGIAGIWEPLAS